jgi:hypothetical protein
MRNAGPPDPAAAGGPEVAPKPEEKGTGYMRQQIAESLNGKITSDAFDVRFAQLACFAASLLVLALSVWKLTRLELTEAQLFFGILLSFVMPLNFIVIGLLLPLSGAARKA